MLLLNWSAKDRACRKSATRPALHSAPAATPRTIDTAVVGVWPMTYLMVASHTAAAINTLTMKSRIAFGRGAVSRAPAGAAVAPTRATAATTHAGAATHKVALVG